MDTSKHLTAYNVRTKQKGRPVLDAVITRTTKGAYMVQGHDEDGTRLTTLVSEEKAIAAVQAGVAEWAPGQEPKPNQSSL